MSEVIRSVYDNQDQILDAIHKLHLPQGKIECDASYGNGVFYKKFERPKFCYDIDPQKVWVRKGCSTQLPLGSSSLNSLIFDPPFLTYVKNARSHKEGKVAMSARFGGYWRYEELEDHYEKSIIEASRVLKKKSVYVFKCQDIIHNHKIKCTHQMVINLCEQNDFRLKDLFILTAKHRMPSPQKGTQKHARVFHSYFLIFQKTK